MGEPALQNVRLARRRPSVPFSKLPEGIWMEFGSEGYREDFGGQER